MPELPPSTPEPPDTTSRQPSVRHARGRPRSGGHRTGRATPVIGPAARRAEEARRLADLLRVTMRSSDDTLELPAEAELVERYATTRNTVREALGLLRAEGVLDRRRGAGTFLSPAPAAHDTARVEGPIAFAPRGEERVAYQVVLLARRPASAAVAGRLRVGPGSPIYLLERLTMLDGEPYAFRTSYLPPAFAPDGRFPDLTGDYWELLEAALGAGVARSEATLEIVPSDAGLAGHLDVAPGTLVVLLEASACAADGTPVDLSFLRVRAEKFRLTYSGVRPQPRER